MEERPIEGLKRRISELLARYESLRSREEQLSAKVAEYEKLIETKDNTIKDLTERLDNLQLTLALGSSSPDRAEAKKKVSQLIKDIDKCIALLND